jgi:dTDP-4-amino-4,6-dideoxygalactose transaminase
VELVREVLESTQWGGFSPSVEAFEQTFADYQNCRYGIAAMNGTVTLEAALEIIGIRPGDEVIVPAISFISTATAVLRAGAVPVFVDIEPDTFHMDPERARAAMSLKTKALILVHFGGPMANMNAFLQLVREYNLILIEDAAHAHGSEWAGQKAGSFGTAGSFSFQNGKVMTAGEGGILTTNDADFAERARSFVNQGRRPNFGSFHHFNLGTNFRMTALQAAVLRAQLERLPEQIKMRAHNAELLKSKLASLPGLMLQRDHPAARVHSHYLFLGRVDRRQFGSARNELYNHLISQGIPCTPFYPHTLYQNPLFAERECRVEPCPVAEACIGDAFWLPHRVLMADAPTILEVASAFHKAHEQ